MHPFPIVFAADIIEILGNLAVPIILAIFWIVSQLSNLGRGADKKQKQVPRPPRDQAVDSEVEDFLRQAAQKIAEEKPVEAEIVAARGAAPKRTRLAPLEAEVVDLDPGVGTGVSARARQHLDTSDISQHSSKLGQRVGQADENVEQHIQEVFDHRLGALEESRPPETTSERSAQWRLSKARQSGPSKVADSGAIPVSVGDIHEMLSSPEQVRNAVILTEILNRPDHRW